MDYMPDFMRGLADATVVTCEGAELPVHSSHLILRCGTLARAPELFAPGAAKTIRHPFIGFSTASVSAFLRCIYQPGEPTFLSDVGAAKLAHMLDADFVPFLLGHMNERVSGLSIAECDANYKVAEVFGFPEFPEELASRITDIMCTPYFRPHAGSPRVRMFTRGETHVGNLAAQAMDISRPIFLGVNDMDAALLAKRVAACHPDLVARVIQAMGTALRRSQLGSVKDPAECVYSVDPLEGTHWTSTCSEKYDEYFVKETGVGVEEWMESEDGLEYMGYAMFHLDMFSDETPRVTSGSFKGLTRDDGHPFEFKIVGDRIQGGIRFTMEVETTRPIAVLYSLGSDCLAVAPKRVFGAGIEPEGEFHLDIFDQMLEIERRMVVICTIHTAHRP